MAGVAVVVHGHGGLGAVRLGCVALVVLRVGFCICGFGVMVAVAAT
ncbi:MAG: hypothetical protein HEQ37_01060 [Acidovorax sp.]|nr:hypothetical protein [Acidovorax sp.]